MDLKVQDVAELLGVSEEKINEWIAEGKIPAYKIKSQYRFSREEVESWMMSERGEKQIYPTEEQKGWQQFSLMRALNQGDVLIDLETPTKELCITESMKELSVSHSMDADVVSEMLLDREKLMPTALNQGIAVPHTRDFLMGGTQDLVAVTFPKNPIEWGALDGKPVFAAFFLFACNDRHHLNLLAKLAHLTTSEKALTFLQSKPSKRELLTFIKHWESSL
ncbi:MAG: PTS sugar transporter subunit IIA [Simkaniaceae bacterium]|nr:PTS sugar transporter subunit IIA [Simkaniaceae bacterium]